MSNALDDLLSDVLAEHGFRKWGDLLNDANWVVCLCGEKVEGREKWQTLLARHQADAILAAGYRKPRTITTAEELDASIYAAFEDAGHLVISDRRGRPWIIWADEDDDAWVDSWPQEEDPDRLRLSDIALPATVLYEPEATK